MGIFSKNPRISFPVNMSPKESVKGIVRSMSGSFHPHWGGLSRINRHASLDYLFLLLYLI